MLASLQRLQPREEEDGDAVLRKLEAMEARLSDLDESLAAARLQSDAACAAQAEQFAGLNAKLDTLLTGEHKQVFRFFVLVPQPAKGYTGRVLRRMKPRHWFAKPMLLVPLYRARNGELKRAPVTKRATHGALPHTVHLPLGALLI